MRGRKEVGGQRAREVGEAYIEVKGLELGGRGGVDEAKVG